MDQDRVETFFSFVAFPSFHCFAKSQKLLGSQRCVGAENWKMMKDGA